MTNNKSKKFFIISIIVLVLILIGGFAYAIFATNLFKSRKDLFFKYAVQIFDDENGFIDNKLEQYNEKKKNSVYEHEGTFSVNVDSKNLDTETLNNVNNLTISFAGNIDNPNSKAEELVKINYNKDVNFPIMYKKVNGVHGLKLSEVSKRYFTVDEDEVRGLIENINSGYNVTGKVSESGSIEWGDISTVDLESDTSITSDSNTKLTKEEKDRLKDTYLSAIKDVLDDSNFTKVTTTESEGYTLEITSEKFKEVLVKLLETMKDDTSMLNKLNKTSGLDITTQNIETLIHNVNQTETDEGKSIITVYQSNDKLNKIEVQYNDEFKVAISKSSNEDNVIYNIDFESQSDSANLKLNYSGLQSLEEITENYELSLNIGTFGTTYSYKVDNKVNFTNNIEIKDFEENEYIDLLSLNSETLNKLMESIAKGIESSNNEKMEEAGIQGENPLITIVPGLSETLALYNSAFNLLEDIPNETVENEESTDNEELSNSTTDSDNNTTIDTSDSEDNDSTTTTDNQNNTTSNNTNTVSDNTTNNTQTNTTSNTASDRDNTTSEGNTSSSGSFVENMEQVTKEAFNEKFKQYEGDNVKGTTVKSLIMQVIANNMLDDGRNIDVTGDIKLTGDEVPDSIQTSKYYKVKCYTDREGYVNKVNITEKN